MSTSNVSYPLMPEWSTAEIIAMSAFYAAVEDLNTVGIKRDEFMEHYHHFLAIEPAKAAQKQLDKAFEKETGFSIYRSVQYVLAHEEKNVKFTGK